jgi:translation initiation factor 1
LQLERRGRRGKAVTTVGGLPLDAPALAELAADLKRRCGCGGAVKGGVIEVQGDQRGVVQAELERRGFRVKRSGG